MVELEGGAVSFIVSPEPGVHRVGGVGVTPNGAEADSQLGWSLASAPEVDGDGWGELLVSAPLANTESGWRTGSVFLLPGGWLARGQQGA